jgi:hypothetical protein
VAAVLNDFWKVNTEKIITCLKVLCVCVCARVSAQVCTHTQNLFDYMSVLIYAVHIVSNVDLTEVYLFYIMYNFFV